MHGSKEDDAEIIAIIDKDVWEEQACMLFLRDEPCPGNLLIRGVITRHGRSTNPVHGTDDEVSDSDSEVSAQGGEDVERDPTLERKRMVQESM